MVKRQAAQLSDLAGGEGMAYIEYNNSKNKELKKGKKGPESEFFRKQRREQERRKKVREKEIRDAQD